MQTTIDHTGNYITETDEPPVPTLTQRAVAELSEFNSQIASLQPYGELTVAADGIGRVEEAHKAVKRLNAAIEKKRKELKAGALEYGRTVDSIAKQLTSAVDAIEGKLGAERERYEAEREAEKKAKEAEKQAVIQARIDQCTAEGIPVVIEKVSLPEEEFLWWFATEKKAAEKRREGQSRAGQLAALGFIEPPETLAKLSPEAWASWLDEAQRKHAAAQARIEEERRQAAEFEAQQLKEREALAAKLKEEQEELRKQRLELERQQKEIAALKAEEQRKAAELERKRREDAAKPELERMQALLESLKDAANIHLRTDMPWWAPEFVTRLSQFAQMMEDFVREGEQ